MNTSEKCGAVFVNDSLVMNHANNYHVGHVETEMNDNKLEENVPNEENKQFNCALSDSPECQF